MKIKKKIFYITLLFSTCFAGCLKDDISPLISVNLADNAKQLFYLEDQEDYINSNNMPSVVNVEEVYNNLDKYLVLDVRTNSEYLAGHISGAVNVMNDSLLHYIGSNDVTKFQKIIIVSSDGQASSYYTCLLRLYGITNVYSLLFGMSQWNPVFSNVWSNNIGDSPAARRFTFGTYSNDSISYLPNINFPNSAKSFPDKIKDRISEILKIGFVNNEVYVSLDPPDSLMFNGESASNFYIVCYGIQPIYSQNSHDSLARGHFPYSVLFLPAEDLKSTDKLQLLPNNKKIVVYSYSGQISAFVTAYLRLLGYDAKSLLYGGNGLFYPFMKKNVSSFSPFVFLTSDIRTYPFVTGPSPK